jgi:hypothetical protein
MTTREELLQKHERRAAVETRRLENERAIISALPEGVAVARVFVGSKHADPLSEANGIIEFTVAYVREAERLMEVLRPCSMSRVYMERDQSRTTAF